jgi:PAS domain S-box-containing protein
VAWTQGPELQLKEAQLLAGLGSWEWDAVSDRVVWSDELYRVFGLEPQSAPASFEAYLSHVHSEDRARVREAVVKAATDGSSFEHQERIVLPGGTTRVLHSRGRAILDDSGRTVRMIGTCQDVTDRHETELERERLLLLERQARKESEASRRLLTNVLERVSDGFVALDKDWCYTHVNEKAGELLGRRPESLIGKHIWSEFPEGVGQRFYHAYHRAIREQIPLTIEEFYPPWNKWFENRIHPAPDGVSIFFQDVTARHQAQEALRESQERFREIAEFVGEVFWIVSPDFKSLHYVSPAFENIFGVPAEPLDKALDHWMSVVHPDDREGLQKNLARGTEARLEGIYRIVRPDGNTRWISWRGFPVPAPGGEAQRIIGFAEDVTELKEIEQALRMTQTQLAQALQNSQDRVVQLEEQVRARASFERLVGKSMPMQEVFRKLRLASQSDVTVLLTGESGTGKELAASAIHSLSERKDQPFVAINCAAIPETLLESELFGHVKGAFTGAVRTKDGLFHAAHGGTLFLDEVAELPLPLQAKVLRALQEREVRRVGDEAVTKVDVRIIAATNRDLSKLLAAGKMREDFYYRIRVFDIGLPALRERREDIPLLTRHFLALFAERTRRGIRVLGPEALRVLMTYSWPGNVRELQNAVEHALVTATGSEITGADLPADIRGTSRAETTLGPEEMADREKISRVLAETGWNRTKAAAAIGVSRVTLWKRMRRYGLLTPPRTAMTVKASTLHRSP